jgi:cytochrome c biogenesis protein CcmG, thiol:disulfide interchange protein DsbE
MKFNFNFLNFLPIIIVLVLVGILWQALFYHQPNQLPSALIGEEVPAFSLKTIINNQETFSQKDLKGRVSLLSVWATWCYACANEHPMLMAISENYHIPIYSILYKDKASDAIEWLQKNGNPYRLIGNDQTGDTAIDFGVYGTPETFVINKQGKIVYRHIGAIDNHVWQKVLYPLVEKLNKEAS